MDKGCVWHCVAVDSVDALSEMMASEVGERSFFLKMDAK